MLTSDVEVINKILRDLPSVGYSEENIVSYLEKLRAYRIHEKENQIRLFKERIFDLEKELAIQ